ncbi:MAG TPA: UDP-N-acetylmuramate--L-alanine ligase [Pirellulales bacterium]|nr:UDP-N-acetylmuramate--L-alanine ligase [Pirellulales bacterium]
MNIALHATRMGFPRLAADTVQRAHLIGLAGSGMQALAELLLERGWSLTGSDLDPTGAAWLAAAGVRIGTGHTAEQVPADCDLVIYSDAVHESNCERRRATELGLPQRSYPSMLGELMAGRFGLAVAGTHGKSTTTAMAAEVLELAGFAPSVVAGGTPLGRNSGGRRGRGQFVLVEACEYRSNFLHLKPRMAVVLGIEPDHFDCFPTCEPLEAAFAAFIRRLPADGLVLANASCAATRRVVAGAACRIATFGVESAADWQAKIIRSIRGRYVFEITRRRRSLGTVALAVPGRHQVLNALAAAALAGECGASDTDIVSGLSRFGGLRRRFEVVGNARGITLLDDYAHHPTEVAATLATVRETYPGQRVCCVFQPHQASRTRFLLDEFAASLHNADVVAVADVFPAREVVTGSDAELALELASRARAGGGMVLTAHDTNGILEQVSTALVPGDVLITLGAGDIRKVCDAFARRLRTHRAAS